MVIEGFTPASALVGGALIGVAVTLLMVANGRIAGVSGILGELLPPWSGDIGWRFSFVAGLIIGAGAYAWVDPAAAVIRIDASLPLLAVGGLAVGFGTRLGGGCTSGHGVCGLARLSGRSLAATLTFMAAAALTVYLARHVLGA
jgi:uncharacterized protein